MRADASPKPKAGDHGDFTVAIIPAPPMGITEDRHRVLEFSPQAFPGFGDLRCSMLGGGAGQNWMGDAMRTKSDPTVFQLARLVPRKGSEPRGRSGRQLDIRLAAEIRDAGEAVGFERVLAAEVEVVGVLVPVLNGI